MHISKKYKLFYLLKVIILNFKCNNLLSEKEKITDLKILMFSISLKFLIKSYSHEKQKSSTMTNYETNHHIKMWVVQNNQ